VRRRLGGALEALASLCGAAPVGKPLFGLTGL
jgi:hypothetical protein